MMPWVRLWHDLPTDPKWRVVAKKSGRSIAEVIAVYVAMLTNAGANASERGVLFGWSDEDAAASLDLEPEHVTAIRDAMQGKTLDGDTLTGWDKRQSNREDGAAERSKRWRERKRTQTNANERLDRDRDIDKDKEEIKIKSMPATQAMRAPKASVSVLDREAVAALAHRLAGGETLTPEEHAAAGLYSLRTYSGRDFREAPEILARCRAGATCHDIADVAEYFAGLVEERPEFWKQYFDATTPFRQSKFDGNLAKARAWIAEGRPYLTPEGERKFRQSSRVALGR